MENPPFIPQRDKKALGQHPVTRGKIQPLTPTNSSQTVGEIFANLRFELIIPYNNCKCNSFFRQNTFFDHVFFVCTKKFETYMFRINHIASPPDLCYN